MPTPARMHTPHDEDLVAERKVPPKNWARKSTVTPSNIAVPFWLAVAPMVRTKREMRGGSLSRVSATRNAVGRVALELEVENSHHARLARLLEEGDRVLFREEGEQQRKYATSEGQAQAAPRRQRPRSLISRSQPNCAARLNMKQNTAIGASWITSPISFIDTSNTPPRRRA